MSHVDADLVNQDPTDKQKDAGNYSKAPFRAQGMRITIENPAGTKRKGVDDDGEPWESELKHDYGYIRSTTGRDKDHIDVFLGPEPHAQQHPIHVIDQMDHDTGDFDEHKVMLGFKSEDDAIKAYHENYPQGWRGFGEITALPLKDFKDWAFDKRRKVKPVSELVAHKTRGYADGGAVGVSAPAKAPAQPAQQKVDIYGQGQRTDSPEKKAFQQSMSDISNQWFADQEGPDEDWGGVRGLAATAKANERMAPILKSMGLNPDDYKDISPHLLNSVMQYNGVNDPVKAVQMVKAYRDATGNAADAPGVRDGIAHALANGSTVQDALNFANNYESSHQSSTSYMKPLIQAGMVAIGGAAAAGAGTGAAAAGAGTGAGTGASGLAGTLGMNAGAGATALNAGALNAGMSLAQGNNIGDALKAGAKGALLSPVGGYVGNAVGGGTLGTIVGNAASGGAGAALSGKDVMSGIRSGAINGIASAAGTAASDWAGGALKDSGLDPSVSGALSKVAGAGTKALVSGKDVGNAALGSAINSGVGYLGDQAGNYIKDATSSWDIPKFNLPDLPDINIDPRLAEYAKTIGTAAIKQNPTVAALTKSGTPGPAIAASAIAALTNGFGGSNGTPGPGDSGTQSPAATTQPAAESPSGSSGQSGGYSGGYGSPAGFLPVDNQQITSQPTELNFQKTLGLNRSYLNPKMTGSMGSYASMVSDKPHMADGGLVSTAKDVAKQAVRGWTAGTLGLPHSMIDLLRMPAREGSPIDRGLEKIGDYLPSQQFYNEWLPGGDWETPEGGLAQEFGGAVGGVGAGTLLKTAAKGVRATPGALTQMAKNATVPRKLNVNRGVVKMPGGNWLSGSVEDSLRGLKAQPDVISGDIINEVSGKNLFGDYRKHYDAGNEIMGLHEWTAANHPDVYGQLLGPQKQALNQFVDKQLTRYVKNDMATERDPIRALAEQGTLHIGQNQLPLGPSVGARSARVGAGFPIEGNARSDLAKGWENATDNPVHRMTANGTGKLNSIVDKFTLGENPWIAKLPKDAPVHEIHGDMTGHTGFNHLIDEMRNAVDPMSGLPEHLRWKPENLDRVSMPQAVQRVADINKWRETQKVEANAAKANNAATVLHKEYPDKGFKWVELKQPEVKTLEGLSSEQRSWYDEYLAGGVSPEQALKESAKRSHASLQDALKYEGDTMGHCVGGYCPDVAEGRSRIFSLRDSKGQPHVTVETQPKKLNGTASQLHYYDIAQKGIASGEFPVFMKDARGRALASEEDRIVEELKANPKYAPADSIIQIKGKANKAPNAEYLPYVQDFVKSGKWSDVGDLGNTGLQHSGRTFTEPQIKYLKDAGVDVPAFATPEEHQAIYQDLVSRFRADGTIKP